MEEMLVAASEMDYARAIGVLLLKGSLLSGWDRLVHLFSGFIFAE
jgi:hypothetical protein